MSNWVETEDMVFNLDAVRCFKYIIEKDNKIGVACYLLQLTYLNGDVETIAFDTEQEGMDCYNKCKAIALNPMVNIEWIEDEQTKT